MDRNIKKSYVSRHCFAIVIIYGNISLVLVQYYTVILKHVVKIDCFVVCISEI